MQSMEPLQPRAAALSAPAGPTISASAYILLSFPLGILYFVFIVTGLTLSVGLLPIFIGLPILLGVLTVAGGIAGFERNLARGVLGSEAEPDPEPSMHPELQAAAGTGFFRRLGRVLTDPASYLHVAMCILKFPIGIMNFVIAVTFACTSAALIAAPAVYLALERTIDIDIFASSYWLTDLIPQATSLQLSFACTAIGVVLLFISVRLIRGLAAWTARLTLAVALTPRR